ncbi:MAG: ABC1 kinase family protein, partial [Myxococcota bacterium]
RLSRLTRIPRTLRNIARGREIIAIIARFGFGDLLDRTGLAPRYARLRRFFRRPAADDAAERYSTEARIRMALAALGPTFIKFGQLLATRPDLLPDTLIEELRQLQDKVPPFPLADVERVISEELGKPVTGLFAEFDPAPLGAASIAQVHRARLASGEQVVVKVQRPDIRHTLRNDLDILHTLAALMEERIPESQQYRPLGLVEEFEKSILREIDFTRELYHLQRFARLLADDSTVYVPRAVEEHCTPRVIVMEYIEGIKVDRLAEIDRAGIDRKTIAENGTRLVLKQVFELGAYHADPHPGNFFVLPDGRICLVDYGMVGTVDAERVDELLTFMVAVLTNDMNRMVRLFGDMGLIDEHVDVRGLKSQTGEFVSRYTDLPLNRLDVGRYLADLFEIIHRFHVGLPSDILLMAKTVATMESVAQSLAPDFDPFSVMRPYLVSLYVNRLTDPEYLVKSAAGTAEDYRRVVKMLPGAIEDVTRKLRRGELRLQLDLPDVRTDAAARAGAANRVATAVVIAADLLVSALFLLFPSGPAILDLPLSVIAGGAGLALGAIATLVLAGAMWRSGPD